MSCNSCNLDKLIVNKKYGICDDCNFARLHNGQSKAEVYSDRKKEKDQSKPFNWYEDKIPSSLLQKKPIVVKTRIKIKPQSSKQKEVSQQLSILKSNIEIEALQDSKYYCWGCGCAKGGLDKSHILSVGQRKDLELIKDNINLFCRTCHNDWESNDILRMLKLHSFEKDLQYIKENDVSRYNQIIDAIIYFITHLDVLNIEDQDVIKKAHNIMNINDFIIK